jgi:hypothetical protein
VPTGQSARQQLSHYLLFHEPELTEVGLGAAYCVVNRVEDRVHRTLFGQWRYRQVNLAKGLLTESPVAAGPAGRCQAKLVDPAR